MAQQQSMLKVLEILLSFNTDGFTVGADGNYTAFNQNGSDIVAWSWDMGGTTASNTNGSITSSVRANTAYGQSIVSYTGTGSRRHNRAWSGICARM